MLVRSDTCVELADPRAIRTFGLPLPADIFGPGANVPATDDDVGLLGAELGLPSDEMRHLGFSMEKVCRYNATAIAEGT